MGPQGIIKRTNKLWVGNGKPKKQYYVTRGRWGNSLALWGKSKQKRLLSIKGGAAAIELRGCQFWDRGPPYWHESRKRGRKRRGELKGMHGGKQEVGHALLFGVLKTRHKQRGR